MTQRTGVRTPDETPELRWGRGHVPHARVPEWLLDADISDRAFRLYALLSRYANGDGRAWPGKKLLADRLGCAKSTLEAALAELAEAGAVAVLPRFRDDGSQAQNDYLLHWSRPEARVGEPDQPGGGEPDPSGAMNEETPRNEETSTPHSPPTVERPRDRPATVDRKTVKDDEYARAQAALIVFNVQAGTRYSGKEWIAKIVMRIREHPELDIVAHEAVIRHALQHPWWSGPASPSVIYGNAALFERCVHAAAGVGVTGEGMTPDEIMRDFGS